MAANEDGSKGASGRSGPAFAVMSFPVNISSAQLPELGIAKTFGRKRLFVDTTKIENTEERKAAKRAARKKAAPKAKRTTPRGSNKKKVKKLARGQSKR